MATQGIQAIMPSEQGFGGVDLFSAQQSTKNNEEKGFLSGLVDTLGKPGIASSIRAGVDLLTFGVNTYYNNKARNRQLRIFKREQKRQEELQKQRIAFERQQAAFNRRMSREQLGMAREAQDFNMAQTLRSNRNESFDRFMQHIVNKMSVDQALRNKFVERGYI